MSDFYYNENLDKIYVYRKITIGELLYLKRRYSHVEVRERGKKGIW